MNYLTNCGTSQSQIGHTRPRLYSLPELMEELGEPFGVLRSLITRYKIRSPFEKSGHGPKQYRLVDFQNALAQGKGIEARIEKDVPLPPRGYGTASKYRPILDAMEVGDSIVMGKLEANALYQFALAKYTHYKITTRKVDDETRRIWRTK